jgi:hypothetical protein
MRMASIAFLVCASAIWLSGCASIMRGATEGVDIESTPPGATVTVLPYGEVYETPARIEIRRKRAVTLLIEKEGYRSTRIYLDREPDRSADLFYHANLILGGLAVGMGIDRDSGALYKLVPNPVEASLELESDAVPDLAAESPWPDATD